MAACSSEGGDPPTPSAPFGGSDCTDASKNSAGVGVRATGIGDDETRASVARSSVASQTTHSRQSRSGADWPCRCWPSTSALRDALSHEHSSEATSDSPRWCRRWMLAVAACADNMMKTRDNRRRLLINPDCRARRPNVQMAFRPARRAPSPHWGHLRRQLLQRRAGRSGLGGRRLQPWGTRIRTLTVAAIQSHNRPTLRTPPADIAGQVVAAAPAVAGREAATAVQEPEARRGDNHGDHERGC